ncbi:GSCOCG00010907001-RA-CDS, partial [Cotesia congregata]
YSWSEEASKLLIYLFKQENVTDYTKFRGKKSLKPKFWTHISKLMQEQGYLVSGRKCSLKWSSLLRHYKSIKDHNAISGNNPEKWDFYENLDKILSEKPYIKPVSVASSDDNREKTPEADMTEKTPKKRKSQTDVVLEYLKESQAERRELQKNKIK